MIGGEHVEVLIVGAGVSGINAGCRLQENCPGKTFAILEARDAIGGTWDLFRFPGIRSDSDLHTFGYEFRPWRSDVAIADGGGLAVTFRRPIEGGEQIARAWIELAHRIPPNAVLLERTVNGQPGLVAQQDGVTVTVFALDVVRDRITHIWVMRNPEKLRPWTTG